MAYIQFDVLPLPCNEINKSAPLFESNLSLCRLFTSCFYFFPCIPDSYTPTYARLCTPLHAGNQPFMKWQNRRRRLVAYPRFATPYNFIRCRPTRRMSNVCMYMYMCVGSPFSVCAPCSNRLCTAQSINNEI